MYEGDLRADAERFAGLGQRIAAGLTSEVSGAEAAGVLAEVLAGVRAGELATCRAVERVDRSGEYASDGSSSVGAYLRGLAGESAGWATKRVLLGRALTDRMPATAAGWEAGLLGLGHADVIRSATAALDDDLAAEIEKVLADAAPHIAPKQLADLAAVVKAAAAPDESEAAAAKNRNAQRLQISKTFDGMYRIDGWLDTEAGAEIAAAIESFTRKRHPDLTAFDDPIAKRRAEALLHMARHATRHAETCDGDGPPRRSLIVAISLAALQDAVGAGDIHGGGTMTAGAVRRLACDAGIIPPSSAPTPRLSTLVKKPGSRPQPYAAASAYVTAGACSRAATGHQQAAKFTTAHTTSTADPPPHPTSTCSASSITTKSTKAVGRTGSWTPTPCTSPHPVADQYGSADDNRSSAEASTKDSTPNPPGPFPRPGEHEDSSNR